MFTFTRAENGVTKFSPKKLKTPNKFWIRNNSFQWEFSFLAAEKLILGGGGITSKLASQ